MEISAFLIVLNEENKIGAVLDSLQWTNERIVVDSGSVDRTVEICKLRNAVIFYRAFDHFEAQKNYALSLAKYPWVISVDADEIVSAALASAICKTISSNPQASGYKVHRKNYFLGKPLQFGGQGKEYLLRVFRRDKGKFSGLVHEQVIVDGTIGVLDGILEHHGTATLPDYFRKFNLYIELEVNRMIQENRVPNYVTAFCRPPLKWVINYFFRAGFLDGWHGFLYHILSCWYDWTRNYKTLIQLKRLRA